MSDLDTRALPIPPVIASAPVNDATHEIARVWWDGQRPRMMIRASFNDYRTAGVLLAEMAHHFANAYADQLGLDRDEVLAGVKKQWDETHQDQDMKVALSTEAVPAEAKE